MAITQVKIKSRAKPALDALAPTDRSRLRAHVRKLRSSAPSQWAKLHLAKRVPATAKLYIARITPQLRAIVEVSDGPVITVLDLVRADALKQFLPQTPRPKSDA